MIQAQTSGSQLNSVDLHQCETLKVEGTDSYGRVKKMVNTKKGDSAIVRCVYVSVATGHPAATLEMQLSRGHGAIEATEASSTSIDSRRTPPVFAPLAPPWRFPVMVLPLAMAKASELSLEVPQRN